MTNLILERRKFLFLAPAVIASTSLMPISTGYLIPDSYYYNPCNTKSKWWAHYPILTGSTGPNPWNWDEGFREISILKVPRILRERYEGQPRISGWV